jgi:hypothetical protein
MKGNQSASFPMVLMNAAGVSSAAGASDGAAAPAITPKARVRALGNRGKAVPATRLTARAVPCDR